MHKKLAIDMWNAMRNASFYRKDAFAKYATKLDLPLYVQTTFSKCGELDGIISFLRKWADSLEQK